MEAGQRISGAVGAAVHGVPFAGDRAELPVAAQHEATALAAKNSWFVPMAPKWADVKSNKVLQQALGDIATGKKTSS